MGDYVFKLPDIGEGVVEGEIVAWHVKVGDSIKEDDQIVDIMTDKATVTIPSPTGGIVTELSGEVGDMIAVGSALVTFSTDGSSSNNQAQNSPEPEVTLEPVIEEEKKPEPIAKEIKKPAPKPVELITESKIVASSGGNTRILASPAVRRRARDADLDLSVVSGSGPAGRIRHADLDAYIAAGGTVTGAPPTSYSTKRTDTNEIKVVGLRRKIAEQMVKSKFSIPHFSYFEEIDVTELEELRQMLNATRDNDQPKLTYLPFIMMALAKIMPNHKECNALYNDESNVVTQYSAVHLGIATQTDRGLFVPVVKHVEAMDIWQSASEMQRVSGAARNGTASLDDLSGSTFTITSLGRDGGLGATPIINHPEVSILGIHKAREMPVVKDGKIVVRRIMNVSSSFDHRIVDGANGAALVQALKRMLEYPALIFM
ncbi:TPA: 2-oxo acid dehydrogenase subunit E2 [Candidatus Thalassarchaeaceae archaeon]|nr:2-oxo acid dehydrogenase subunit E2 [Euryarchaeota archaeon]MDG1548272.1 dihydrolipoamide acetyltransferase family protein [Candidatus Thalassarchaeaceae archaeon]DAC65870.1 MAG TPA: 2-oxo acid dehydrogenase subunit E2 [Candidatus Poseidoniales archaeon]HII42620.1 2-oxo acid dehydrogenase subunit E2 [Candidatus Thalassarchaeaceae archaeon]